MGLLEISIILLVGYFCGKIAKWLGLPQITGYIFAGLLLNPTLWNPLLLESTYGATLLTDICLAFITFEVGLHLTLKKVKESGRALLLFTCAESLGAFLLVLLGFLGYLSFFNQALSPFLIFPFSILIASLAAPTDPSATLAIIHEYKAEGKVTDTIMGIAAFDDLAGILLFTIATGIIAILESTSASGIEITLTFITDIGGSVLLGILGGGCLILISRIPPKLSIGDHIILILAFLTLSFGISDWLQLDAVLLTLIMGIVTANFHPYKIEIIKVIEGYTEQLVFLLFFVIGGMKLNFLIIGNVLPLILIFVLLRGVGKYMGILSVARLIKFKWTTAKYIPGGLIPQGGIVIGLALLIQKNQLFSEFSDLLVGIIMGATVVHEIIGPFIARQSLKIAGEYQN